MLKLDTCEGKRLSDPLTVNMPMWVLELLNRAISPAIVKYITKEEENKKYCEWELTIKLVLAENVIEVFNSSLDQAKKSVN